MKQVNSEPENFINHIFVLWMILMHMQLLKVVNKLLNQRQSTLKGILFILIHNNRNKRNQDCLGNSAQKREGQNT